MDIFNNILRIQLQNIWNNNSDTLFEEEFLQVLKKQAPSKTKLLRYKVEKGKIVLPIQKCWLKFINLTRTLNLKSSKKSNSNYIMELIFQFNDHASIEKIKESYSQITPGCLYI